MSRRVHGWLHDEQGDRSMARLAFAWTLPFTGVIILIDVLTPLPVAGEVYALLAGVLTGEIAWAGGAHIARYLGPQVAGAFAAIQSRFAGVAPGTTTVSVTPGATIPAVPASADTPIEPPPEK